VPLRVVAQRLSPEDADRLARRSARPAYSTPPAPRPAAAPARAAVAAPAPSAVVDRRAPSDPALPVLGRRRRRPFERLLALVRARRRVEVVGRHRPGTNSTQGWSMFAPNRRAPRRFGARR
jgi:hypothetical protein